MRESLSSGAKLSAEVNLPRMDLQLYAIIESEREADEAFETVSDAELEPVAVTFDDDGARIETYADCSSVAYGPGGELL